MGLLGWFGRRSPLICEPDRVWLTRSAALAGLYRDVAGRLDRDALVLVGAHFPATLGQVQTTVESGGLEYDLLAEPLCGAGLARRIASGGARLLLVPAAALPAGEPPAAEMDRSRSVSILMAERHPLRSHDRQIEEFAAALPHPTHLGFYVALDDALMKGFAGEWVEGVLRVLGMNENDAISARGVTRAVKKAQAKLQERVFSDRPADSADEWYRLNVPDAQG